LALAVALVAAGQCLPARAEQKTIPTIGFLSILSSAKSKPFSDVFVAGLRDLGYIEGRTIRIAWRFADDDAKRLEEQAAELVARNVD
jgi:hypothetical protein